MGILSLNDVADLEHSVLTEQRSLSLDPDDAAPIGRRANSPTSHTATWITFDKTAGELIYGPEIPIEVYRGYEKLLPGTLQEKLRTRDLRGWLFQVRASGPNPNPQSFSLLDGKEVLLSKLPHSRNYFMRRTLKPCKQERSIWSQIERAWDRYSKIHLLDERVDHILQTLGATPFLGFKESRAAWAISPERFGVLGPERFDRSDDYTIAALDLPFEMAVKGLESDPKVQHALDLTDSGSLFHRYRTAQSVRTRVRNGFDAGKGPVCPPVTEGLYENRHELMRVAIYGALCGRETPETRDSVADSAVRLYHRFAYNFIDREDNPVRRPYRAEKSLDQLAASLRGPAWSEDFKEEERTREYTAEWREMGMDLSLPRLLELINHVLQASSDSIDEVFVRTLRPALAGWPPGWKKPEGFGGALQRLNQVAQSDSWSQ